jgi:hypothetical protein
MTLVDLMSSGSLDHGLDEDNEGLLDDEELQIIKDAGIIPRLSKGRENGRRKPKHIVFVDNEEEGSSILLPG